MNTGDNEKDGGGAVAPDRGARSGRFWVWVLVACVLQFSGWVAWFAVTAGTKIDEVPLATAHERSSRKE